MTKPVPVTPATVVGVDLGKRGGVAILRGRQLVHAARMPLDALGAVDVASAVELCRCAELVCIEQPIPVRHGAGVDSGYSALREALGVWRTAAIMAGAAVLEVPPLTWQSSVLRGFPGLSTKARSVAFVRRVYPTADLLPGKVRREHDGVADAVCIAHYARAWMELQRAYQDRIGT